MDLEKAYTDPSHPGSYGGVNALYRTLKGKVKTKEIRKYLRTKDSHTLHAPARKHFLKNRVIVGGIDEQFQTDLVDMQSMAAENAPYKYIITCIDVFSKYAWAIPIPNKTGPTIVKAFEIIFAERKPESLQSDAGKEFTNQLFQSFLKKHRVHFFTTHNQTKASVVERFNRTLKTKMWKYFTEKNTHRYIEVLPDLLKSYNNTWHRSIRIEPINVTIDNQARVWKTLYEKPHPPTRPADLKVGDTVRISKKKLHFEKGYERNWTREIFTIHQVIPRNPIVYKVKDLAGDVIHGTFYKQELQKVTDSGYYPVEKVLKTRTKDGKKEFFVKFQGYPDKFNAWVSDVKKL